MTYIVTARFFDQVVVFTTTLQEEAQEIHDDLLGDGAIYCAILTGTQLQDWVEER